MKICLIRSFYLRGSSERILLGTIKGLLKRGNDVILLTSYVNDDILNKLKAINIEFIKKVENLPTMSYQSLLLNDKKFSKMLTPLIKRIECDFILALDDFCLSIAECSRRAPLIYWCQGLPLSIPLTFMFEQRKLQSFLVKFCSPFLLTKIKKYIAKFDYVLSNSHYTKEWLYFFTGIRSKVLYPPVDCELFKPMKSDWHNFKYILTPSSQVEVNVIKNLAKHYPIVTFGGKNIDGCKNMGYISDEELVKLYSAAFVLLFPQIHEPFGYIPVESMACGTPVIAYDEQGPKETIVNEKTGWLVADEQEFMKKVEEVWQGYEIGIRQFCRKHILSKYSTEIFFYSLVQTIHYDDDNC